MGDFFHGWRRKTGCVMLVIACMATLAWVRSLVVADHFRCTMSTKHMRFVLATCPHYSVWMIVDDRDQSPQTPFVWWNSSFDFPNIFEQGQDFDFWWPWFGFGIGVSTIPESSAGGRFRGVTRIWAIPYWVIVCPATLLSACLLLSNAQKNKTNRYGSNFDVTLRR